MAMWFRFFSIEDFRPNTVTISGAISRPGTYEIDGELFLSDLIKKADNVLGDAYLDRVDIKRVKEDLTEQLLKLDLGEALNKNPDHDIILQGRDRVTIYSLKSMAGIPYVSISGFVKDPGTYPLLDNMNLYDLVFSGGGFINEEVKNKTYLKRAELIRYDEKQEKELMVFNLDKLLKKQEYINFELQNRDEVIIYSSDYVVGGNRFVTISGYVKKPGLYELYEKNMTVYDLIFKAGGFEDPLHIAKAFTDRADLIRFEDDRITKVIIPFKLKEVLMNKESEQNFLLKPGDEIKIYSQDVFNTVRNVSIFGEVNNPGTYELKTGMNIKDIIIEAGGVARDIYKYKIEISRIDPQILNEDIYAEKFELDMLYDYSISNVKYEIKDTSLDVSINRDGFILEPYDIVIVRPNPF